MAITSSTSNFFSLFPTTQTPKPNFPFSLKPHFSNPLKLPSISLKTPENPINRNKLFITSMATYNVQVVVEENESEDRLLNRFKREVMKAGVIQECRRRRWFENSQEKKKRITRDAARKNRKRRFQPRVANQNNSETPTKEVDDFDDDNWELPEGDLPY